MQKNTFGTREYKKREEAFKNLPANVRNSFTPEEREIFLHSEVWPEDLCEKLSEFLFPAEDEVTDKGKKPQP
ncbi:hypothetical protein OOT00_00785 [Desulfobotulus sp. H1]|uniref:Uncharacterized protein n=1 Tax=Desulfobotulus pelophilus TaxID=2823377 RepID=A0ABT3N4X7_9BACT|nr:hypothetical protein [Desulfobotulus pelophilus]MCW7752515.1 hypothetical protein [Desulfobotulus pelophilus]